MWGRRTSYKNQWTNKREATIAWILVSIFFTLVLHHVTGTVAVRTLRDWLTVIIMSVPAIFGGGFWLGTAQTRGYEKGVSEKASRSERPIVIQPSEYLPQLPEGPRVTHRELIDAQST
jgi:hypothetical protein